MVDVSLNYFELIFEFAELVLKELELVELEVDLGFGAVFLLLCVEEVDLVINH